MPNLGDAEAVTRESVGEFMGKDSDKGIWRYFRNHWHGCSPGWVRVPTSPNNAPTYGD